MPSAPEYPRLVKHGSVVVKVYRVKQKTTASGWAYSVACVSSGRRRLQQFADEGQAMEEARIKAGQIAEGRQELAELTRSARDDMLAARDLCAGVPLLSALEEWRKARDIIEGQILPAAEAWAARNTTKFTRIKVWPTPLRRSSPQKPASKASAPTDRNSARSKPTFLTGISIRSSSQHGRSHRACS